MLRRILGSIFYKEEYVWRNQDFDIPVTFICVAGELHGRKFAKVFFEGKESYVPMDELVVVRVRK